MNIVWIIIMLASIVMLIFADPSAILSGMITGANGAVSLAISLIAIYGLWLGLFEILEKTGLSGRLAKLLRPVIRFLFKGESDECEKYISMNISANLLGLGNAATPMGIGAINTMLPNKKNEKKASLNMIMFVVISATSLQIFPSTVIGLRAAAGSANAADFIFPCIIATVSSTVIGIIMVKFIGRFIERNPGRAKKRGAPAGMLIGKQVNKPDEISYVTKKHGKQASEKLPLGNRRGIK